MVSYHTPDQRFGDGGRRPASSSRKMEMVAAEEIERIGEELTPPLSPISFSLHDSFLHSHCSSCFSPLPPNPLKSLHLFYCSLSCSSSHSPLHFSSASHHLNTTAKTDTADLRAALLLLLQINHHKPSQQSDRICGLMSNRRKFLDSSDGDDEVFTRIRNGAAAMAAAARMRDEGKGFDFSDYHECLLEEAVLCVVLTNAVEVQDKDGRFVGIAVYDTDFSWINHSCSPNACYSFLPPGSQCGGSRRLITPAPADGCKSVQLSTNCNFLNGSQVRSGPRVVVRSIKPMKKGEEVTIAYTDLLQPKELRQSDLWSKYRFTCGCRRCVAIPPTCIDHCLMEISVFSMDSSDQRQCHEVGVEKLAENIDDAINEYLSSGDAESCCKKLENTLINGVHYEQSNKEHRITLNTHHHLALNSYTTLASAYKILSIDSSAMKMKRFSAAYSLLLAGQTHHLFLSEPSLIASAANFWIGAAELVLNLARTLVPNHASERLIYRCSKCKLIDMFEASFDHGQDPKKVLDISMEFLDCLAFVTPKIWRFLVHDNCFLGVIKDPFDKGSDLKKITSKCEEGYEGQESVDFLCLGGHCLLFGGILSNIYGGQDSYLSCFVRNLLYDGGTH